MKNLSVVIPTYRRGEVLIVDQTEEHPPEILEIFQGLEKID